jgi:hypothetical protein
MTRSEPGDEPQILSRHIFVGIAIILLGVAMLADRYDGWGLRLSVSWWPVLLLLLGGAKMIDPGSSEGCRRSRRGGAWLLAVGVWGLISEAGLFGLDYSTSWPLLVIASGAGIVWHALGRSAHPRRTQES